MTHETAEQIIVEKYYNPTLPGNFGWMAHSVAFHAEGVYGFGRTEQEAADDFNKQLSEDA